MNTSISRSLMAALLILAMGSEESRAAEPAPPVIVAHRGLLKHAPEDTLAAYRAWVALQLGFAFDVREARDGRLVCIHEGTLGRTTNGRGEVVSHTLAELKSLDAGGWFGPAFRGERIPTIQEVVRLLPPGGQTVLAAADLKVDDVEAGVVELAKREGVLDRILFIGTTINTPQVRRKLRAADATSHVACLAQTAADLPAALEDKDSDWAYLRYIPAASEVERIRKAGKRAFVAGPTVAGHEPENWKRAISAGVDAILTDYPLELAAVIRESVKAGDPKKEVSMDARFEALAEMYLKEYPALSPVGATSLGDHRFDDQLDDVSEAARNRQLELCRRYAKELEAIPREKLSRENQVDYQLLGHALAREIWEVERLQEWAWNPVVYTQLTGSGIYSLTARNYAPIEQRLKSAAARLEQYPRLFRQIRETLQPKRVPAIHAETAVKQNRGVLSIIENSIRPEMEKLPAEDRKRLEAAIATATDAVEEHQKWLEKELVPKAGGNFRIGKELYDEKLALTLGTGLSRQEVRDRAEFEIQRVRKEMYELARIVLKKEKPDLPADPSAEMLQATVEAALEKAATDIPPRDGVVSTAEKTLEVATEFVRKKDLVTIPADPVDIIVMPEFQRGVSVAYCDSPGPLEVGQKTFYAVAPLPADWSDAQCTSFLREYNIRSLHNLTIHEAMPGHFLQIAHSNRNPRRLRALLGSGVFIEGWAVYTEQMMSEQGYLDGDPLMRMVMLKWYLRTAANAILDQSIHVDGMNREAAMHLMQKQTFQEEREAAGKWVRAQLTSAQLATYFVGVQEHRDMRDAAKKAWGKDFTLKRYHDGAISFGSPPTRFVKALLLDEPIPASR